ncbi:MAG TPA: periplasmic heavy metal sensor [Vicinamibacterales bacterium]|nr:periplasmic heavy metal sensor [Vicinamibacterales bacterium]
MTIHRKRFLVGAGALVLAFGVAGSSYVSAQNTNPDRPAFRGGRMGPGGPGMPGGPLEMLLGRGAERLGLSDAQQSQIKSILDSHKTEVQGLMKQVADARHALVAAQVSGQTDDQILQLWSNVSQAEGRMAVAQAHVIAEAMQVLTADQQAQVKQIVTNGPPQGRRGRGKQ